MTEDFEELCSNAVRYTGMYRKYYTDVGSGEGPEPAEIALLWQDCTSVKGKLSSGVETPVFTTIAAYHINRESFLEEYLAELGELSSDILSEIAKVKAHKEKLFPTKAPKHRVSKKTADKLAVKLKKP